MEKEVLKQLKEEFLKLYTRKEEIVSGELTSAYVLYTDLIGRYEFEIFNYEIQVKALRLKIKLAQAYLNRNESPDINTIEQRIRQLWKEHEEKLQNMMTGIQLADSATTVNAAIIEDCRAIYRMLVKKLHPDLHPELSEELHDMLIVAQAAYKQHDVSTLRQLVIKYHFLSDSLDVETDFDDVNFVKQLSEQIENLKVLIEQYENSFPLNCLENLSDEKWVKNQQQLMQQKLKQLKKEVSKLENNYSLVIEC